MLQPEHAVHIVNRADVIKLTAWILLVVAGFATVIKVLSKFFLVGRIEADDVHATLALASAGAYVGFLSVQTDNGLGRNITSTDKAERSRYGKAEYGSEMFYILSIGFAKWALLEFLVTLVLARDTINRLVTRTTLFVNIALTISALLAIAFQCGLPEPWNVLEGRCFDRTAFWIAFGTVDILLDISTLLLPLYLLGRLQMRKKRRVTATLAFSSRTLMIPVIVVRLYYISRYSSSTDPTYDYYPIAIATSVHIVTSILTTCIPFLKPILEGLQSGVFTTELYTSAGSSRMNQLQQPSRNIERTEGRSMALVGKRNNPDPRFIHKHTEISLQFDEAVKSEFQMLRGESGIYNNP